MVTLSKPNRTSDTTDFARNTVPVKDQTATDPTVKKTDPPWKNLRKPNHDFIKNKLRGDRTKSNGGPPGPDASMLAYNAFTPQLVEPTTERHVRKPFTTKSRPPPLSYLTSTADSPLPPTAWALTTLKGSAPAVAAGAAVEPVRNTIPAAASDPQKALRPRTTLSSVKPINSFWSSRLYKHLSTVTAFPYQETTEPIESEENSQETLKNSTTISTTTEKVPTVKENQLDKINEGEKLEITPELTPPENTTTSLTAGVKIDEAESQTVEANKTQEREMEEEPVVLTPKQLNHTNNIDDELETSKITPQNDTMKLEQSVDINETIKTDEKHQLTKIHEDNLDHDENEGKFIIIKKPTDIKFNDKINNLKHKNGQDNKVEKFLVGSNHTTESYGNSLTEKPYRDVGSINDRIDEAEMVSEKPRKASAVTELTKLVPENVRDIEQENNYNTAVYPFGNIINETKFTHKLLGDGKSLLKDIISGVNLSETEHNTVYSKSPPELLVNHRSLVNESDQSTTSMTRATNATQPPINTTTESNLIRITTTVKVSVEPAVTETVPSTVTTTSIPTVTVQEEETTILTTVIDNTSPTIRNDFKELTSSALIQNSTGFTTVTLSPYSVQTFVTTPRQEFNATTDGPYGVVKESVVDSAGNITEVNLVNSLDKIIHFNNTAKENDIKSITALESPKNFTKSTSIPLSTTPTTLTPILSTLKVNPKWNNSVNSIRKHYELNQTSNDIKLGGDIDLPVPTIINNISPQLSTRTNFIKTTTTEKAITTTEKTITTTEKAITTTEKAITTTMKLAEKTELPDFIFTNSSATITDTNFIKEKPTTLTMKTQTDYPVKDNSETTTVFPAIFRETDDFNEDDSLMYNATGIDKKFGIDSPVVNITDHEIDENVEDAVSGEKDVPELIAGMSNSTVLPEETTVPDQLLKKVVNTELPMTTETVLSSTTPRTTTLATTPIMEEDNVTPIEEDNTGMEIEDYDTGVIVPMNVLLFVHATYKDMCSSKDVLIEAIVRFFKTVADRSVDRKQIRILNLVRECVSPYPADKGVVPVHILITDLQGQYDKRLTDDFVRHIRQEASFPFKYPITKVDKSIAHEMNMDAAPQGSGTLIAAIVISSIAGLCLLILTILLVIMRKRQRGFNYGQRCTPVSLDGYSLDNISVCNSVRRKAMRASKRSYGNPAFDDPTAITNSLNFAGLANAVSDIAKLEDEYTKIPVVTVKPDELPPGAEVRNRYANVIPLPETRVTLNTPNNNDLEQFINANFVKGAKGAEKFYIACQAPLKETIKDFWQMIWEQQSRIVIMLTDLHENGVDKCADYLPPSEVLDCHRVFGDLQVTLKKREAREKYIISSLQLKNLDSNLWREVTHMWYVGWPGRGVPDDLSSIIAFLIEARSYAKNGPPIVVHCSPGTGRTGTIIAIDIAIRDFETDRAVDIPRTVYNIRRDRAGAVQTSQQYAFIYQVLHLYATKLTGGGLDSI
ncbi:uncharacterized protein isoform X2 [Rhodnius prolixus]